MEINVSNNDIKALSDIVYDWMKQMLYSMNGLGLWLDAIHMRDFGFEWTLINDVEFQGPTVGLKPCRDYDGNIIGYDIYNCYWNHKYVNIIIRNDGVTWNEHTEYRDFTKDQMYSLYEKILAYYQKGGQNVYKEMAEKQKEQMV